VPPTIPRDYGFLSRLSRALSKPVNLGYSEEGVGMRYIDHIDDESCMVLAVLACCPGGMTREGKEGLDHTSSQDIRLPIPELLSRAQPGTLGGAVL
jgi:hypothetical protein